MINIFYLLKPIFQILRILFRISQCKWRLSITMQLLIWFFITTGDQSSTSSNHLKGCTDCRKYMKIFQRYQSIIVGKSAETVFKLFSANMKTQNMHWNYCPWISEQSNSLNFSAVFLKDTHIFKIPPYIIYKQYFNINLRLELDLTLSQSLIKQNRFTPSPSPWV